MKAIFYILVGGMALTFTAIGGYCLYDTINLQYYGKQASGTVTGYETSYSNSNPFTQEGNSDFQSTGSYSSDSYYTQIAFYTEDDKLVYYESDAGSDSPEYSVGDEVLVYYDPGDPFHAKIGNEGWILPLIFIPIGLLLFFAVWKVPGLFGWTS